MKNLSKSDKFQEIQELILRVYVDLEQRCPTGGPQLDLIRPPPSHRFGSIGESFNICLMLLVQHKI
jgi:hypothetical protein